uniref:Uncharacterized protein n=1 Tax=Arundo donax TaxID=35708 RepID=A0A0A9A614_ARUDO
MEMFNSKYVLHIIPSKFLSFSRIYIQNISFVLK